MRLLPARPLARIYRCLHALVLVSPNLSVSKLSVRSKGLP
jgi:hypothetical protein